MLDIHLAYHTTSHPYAMIDPHSGSDATYAFVARQIIEASPSGMVLVDALAPDMPLVYVNSAFEEMTGYSRDAVIGLNCRFLQGDDRQQPALDTLRLAIKNQVECTVTLRNYRRDGRMFWNELRIAPLSDPSGRVTHFIGIQNDVTERVLTEEMLREDHAELDRFFAVVLDLMCITDLHGYFIRLNKAWETTLGFTLEELEGFRYIELVHPDDVERTVGAMQALAEHKPIEYFVNRYRTKDGGYRAIEWRANAYGNLVYAAARDVTDRVRMEEELRASEAFLQSVVNNRNTLVLRTDLEGRYTYVNDTMLERMSWMYPTRQAMLGTDSLASILPEDHAATVEVVAQCIANPGTTVQVELRKPRRDGSSFWTVWEFMAVTDSAGTVTGIQCIGIDIDERKQVAQREFEIALERARLHILTQLIQNVSHEFRTPLAVILSSTHLMTRLDEHARRAEKAAQIENQVTQITRLVDMMVIMAKLEDAGHLMPMPVDLNAVIDDACARTGANIRDDLNVSCTHQPDLPRVMADSVYITEAVCQILDNALRFTPAGGSVAVATGSDDQYVWIDISDTGPGIAESDLPSVFESFWRADQAHSTPGFGLGLALTQKIVVMHGGKIEIHSTLGQGSRFRLMLPVKPSGESATGVG
jgi:PAS domain S-box-containing protein